MVEQGDVSRVLVRESRAHDLVVLGKFGESQSAAYRDIPPLGAHIEEVVRRSYAPVVLVPPGASLGRRFLVAYDGSPGAHRALGLAVRLRRVAEGELSVLAVSNPAHTEVLLGQVSRYLQTHETEAVLEAREGEASEQILEYATEWRADLLAMGAFGRGTLQQRRDSATPAVLYGLDRVALVCGPMES
jgi:nucleotide-binding universal stress UspA family protein